MNYDRFDLEEQIMKCWSVVDDVNDLYEHIGDSGEFVDMPPKYVDKVMNKLLGVKELYDMRFQKLWDVFDYMIKDGQFQNDFYNDEFVQLELEGIDDIPLRDLTDTEIIDLKYGD
jgi:hypothetical protein